MSDILYAKFGNLVEDYNKRACEIIIKTKPIRNLLTALGKSADRHELDLLYNHTDVYTSRNGPEVDDIREYICAVRNLTNFIIFFREHTIRTRDTFNKNNIWVVKTYDPLTLMRIEYDIARLSLELKWLDKIIPEASKKINEFLENDLERYLKSHRSINLLLKHRNSIKRLQKLHTGF